ncbi:MAG: protein translocase subunit SecD [Clostridiales bacterium]|nr:protein translocase subunit SecD [Clostridiales bacterium]
MKKSRGIAVLVLTLAITVFLGYVTLVGIGQTGSGSARNITTGLDLSGGVSITYQTTTDNPSSSDMSDTVYKMQQRVSQYSTEAQAYQEGDNRITIEIPGVSDANEILAELGKPGSLYFITMEDEDGNTNVTTGDSDSGYVLARDLDEIIESGSVVLEGTDIKEATGGAYTDSSTSSQEYAVELELTSDGTEKFATATEENVGNQIAIVYDEEVLSAPVVNEAITGGQAQITGMESTEEAQNLASFIRIGSLSLELEEVESRVVAAQLGVEAISTSVRAGVIGILIVFLIMIAAYRVSGVVVSLALLIYTFLNLIAINAFDITLTLPGIAGIILGIGMAVDANVIIYARINEEISGGSSVRVAIHNGFSKAFSAIFDGNVTTLIACLVLIWLSSGSVKGFAYTLALSIVISMFTSLVVSRWLANAVYAVGVRDAKFYGKAHSWKHFDFVKKRKTFFIIALVAVLCGPVGMLANSAMGNGALNFGLEFSGGTSTTVTFNEEMTIDEIDTEVTPVVESVTGDSNVQPTKVVGTTQVVIKTRSLSLDERTELNEALVENFDVDEDLIESENISSTISSEMRRDAVLAVVVATILMLIYIWIRFKDVRFAGSAVIALLHDVGVVLTCYALIRISVGNTFIACMLAIFGYSINATIVIFDRIRENLRGRRLVPEEELKDLVNSSISETLTRSILTSLTTFVMVLILYIMGVSSIREFALPLMVGVVAGAYSSVFVTGSLWYFFRTRFGMKEAASVEAKSSGTVSEAGKRGTSGSSDKTGKNVSGEEKTRQNSGNAQPKKKNRKRVQERQAREAQNSSGEETSDK